MIYIGTSGFKFADWKGSFYPEGLSDRDWLTYYGERFDCVEVNSTYYRLVHPRTFFHMANKVPAGFQFTVKAYGGLTHEPSESRDADFESFIGSLQPLIEADKFGCVLAQFPHRFHNTQENRAYLAEFGERFTGLPLVVEFRSREWAEQPVFDFLREHGVGYCAVDEPQFKSLMPPVAVATSPVGYVRFHGRNYEKWWKGDNKTRYDYLYSEDELREWVPKIDQLQQETEKVYVFMNNCFGGKAATNAAQMKELLQQELPA
ncbi:MAG: DUF72 domain-containing protein [Armatimonadota bacterium]|nr:MAG: DUF72 domain-containing protein [Armatimonadota bacterium]